MSENISLEELEKLLQFTHAAIEVDENIKLAHIKAKEINIIPLSHQMGSLISILAAVSVKSNSPVLEIGTGSGIGSLWLLSGLPVGTTLTTITTHPEHLTIAKSVCNSFIQNSNRIRFLIGDTLQLLNKLTEKNYELVLVNDGTSLIPTHLEATLRILKPGGMLLINNPGIFSDNPEITLQAKTNLKIIAENPNLLTTIIPLDRGLVLATPAK